MNPNPTTFTDLPTGLSNLLGAYDEGHWQTAVMEIKGGIGILLRGTVLASGSGGDVGKLVPLSASTEAAAYGLLLDEAVDTSVGLLGRLGDGLDRESGLVSRSRAHRPDGRRRGLDLSRPSRSRHLRRGPDHRTVGSSDSRRSARRVEVEVEVVDRLFVLANYHSGRSCPDSLFGATGTLVPNEKRL